MTDDAQFSNGKLNNDLVLGLHDFGDGTSAAKSVLADPDTGLPLDPLTPVNVKLPDDGPYTLSLAALNAAVIIDLEGYNSLTFNISAMPASSVLSVTSSEDGLTNWLASPIEPIGSPTGNGTLTQVSTTGAWMAPRKGSYIRLQLTTYGGSGTLTGQYARSSAIFTPRALIAHGAVAHDAPIVGYPVRIGARARSSNLSAVANDDTVDLAASTIGHLLVNDPVSLGSPTDAAWDGVASSASVIAILKKIALNTSP